MTISTNNALYNLASFIEREYNKIRVFQNTCFLYLITLFLLFPLSTPSATWHGNSKPEQLPVPQTSGGTIRTTLHTSQPEKIRERSAYSSIPGKVIPAAIDTEGLVIRSVVAPKLFSYSVVQQPVNDPYYVSKSRNLVTEFGLAKAYNNIGLLAHNNLAGKAFQFLTLGQEIQIVRKNGQLDRYIVSAIYRFQALEPDKTEGQFIDLDTNQTLTATELFTRMYTGEPHLTFQTCIYARGDPSWGRLFVIATPVSSGQ